jgi:hypothetical protein
MPEDITVQVSSDLAPAIEAVAQASVRIASLRAAKVAEVSGGAVTTTPDQLTAITAAASAELFADLRQQLRDVINVYIVNISTGA